MQSDDYSKAITYVGKKPDIDCLLYTSDAADE